MVTDLEETSWESKTFFNQPTVSGPKEGGQVHCPCNQLICQTDIISNRQQHEVTCNGNSFVIPCGGPLMVNSFLYT